MPSQSLAISQPNPLASTDSPLAFLSSLILSSNTTAITCDPEPILETVISDPSGIAIMFASSEAGDSVGETETPQFSGDAT
jgi:hypothetical protein